VEGAHQRIAVNAQTAAVQSSVRNQQAAQKRAAEQVGQQDADRETTRAEPDAQAKVQQATARERDEIDSAAEEVVDAVDDHLSAVCKAHRAPRRKPIASDGRPTN
jgi:hypothetical protein